MSFLRRLLRGPTELDKRKLRRLLGTDEPTILEIGANDGKDTSEFRRLFPRARICAFEPDPRAFADLEARLGDRVELFEIAIGAEDGTATLHLSDRSDDWNGGVWHKSSSLARPTGHVESAPHVTFEATAEVRVRRLDGWVAEQGIERIDFVWADVQGAENRMIEGGREALSRTRFLYTEYADEELYEGQWTLRRILEELPDFTLERRYPNDALLRNRRCSAFAENLN